MQEKREKGGKSIGKEGLVIIRTGREEKRSYSMWRQDSLVEDDICKVSCENIKRKLGIRFRRKGTFSLSGCVAEGEEEEEEEEDKKSVFFAIGKMACIVP